MLLLNLIYEKIKSSIYEITSSFWLQFNKDMLLISIVESPF